LDALNPCQEIYTNMCEYLKNDNCKAAKECFEAYVSEIRAIHDLSGIYVSSYSTILLEHTKQNLTVEIMQAALESCGLLQGMWGLIASLPPIGVALFLAEHLRGHFSGADRKGAVKILEEADCYKLIFEPCGTGGVLRQVKTKGLGILPESSPYTWGRKNEVPVYCSHCAKNELTSYEKLGFLAWVTEFNPDSSMPCGWTIYKDRNKIPKKYYERLQLI